MLEIIQFLSQIFWTVAYFSYWLMSGVTNLLGVIFSKFVNPKRVLLFVFYILRKVPGPIGIYAKLTNVLIDLVQDVHKGKPEKQALEDALLKLSNTFWFKGRFGKIVSKYFLRYAEKLLSRLHVSGYFTKERLEKAIPEIRNDVENLIQKVFKKAQDENVAPSISLSIASQNAKDPHDYDIRTGLPKNLVQNEAIPEDLKNDATRRLWNNNKLFKYN